MKTKRYWLRGGVISVILVGLITLILFILFPSQPNDMVPAASVPVLIGMAPVNLISYYLHINTNFFWSSRLGSNIMTIISAIDYFLVGSILGWIYGKIKSRRQFGKITR